ncbi:MAG: SDR family oxidoreductase [Flavobacteriaceae bacterium]|nr:SDR family oxidoreductase [Flavobacteriaceae bacterium]
MSNFKGKRVLITGGASGIGRIIGQLALKKGAELIIWDIDQLNIKNALSELDKLGKVHKYRVDVSNIAQVKETATLVKAQIGTVDILINNAGIVVGKYFQDHSTEEILRTMDINANAPMIITRQFLPEMIAQNAGHICNIASSASLISNPRMSVYAASKWSVMGWSDSLRLEMQQQKLNVNITTVLPYYISTGMFRGVRSVVPILKPEKVARKIIRAIERDRIIISMPWSVHFVRFFQGLLPIWFFDWFVGRVMGIYKTMEHFKGRKD